MQEVVDLNSSCHACALRRRAQAKPESLFAKVWRWHTGWCPGWKAYVKECKEKGLEVPTA